MFSPTLIFTQACLLVRVNRFLFPFLLPRILPATHPLVPLMFAGTSFFARLVGSLLSLEMGLPSPLPCLLNSLILLSRQIFCLMTFITYCSVFRLLSFRSFYCPAYLFVRRPFSIASFYCLF